MDLRPKVMTVANCLIDSSSVVPLGLYRLFVAGLSRSIIFTGYGSLCFVLSMCLAYSWHGAPGARLHAANKKESNAADSNTDAVTHPRLHGLSLKKQLYSLEFGFAVTFVTTQLFRSNAFLGVIKDLLQNLGDAETGNLFTQILTSLLPASTVFIPLFDICMKRGGFAVTFFIVLVLGVTWNVVMLIPDLPVQVVGFAAFTNFRGLLFASFFTYAGHTFGNRTFGRIIAILWFLTFLMSLLIWPCTELSKALSGDLTFMNIFMLVLCLPCFVLTLLLGLHLRKHPAGDIIPLRPTAKPDV